MRRVRSTDTIPERRVRSLLHKLGYRFRLNQQNLPGKPDIVLPKHRTVVFVHGCFWHRHEDCAHATTPSSRQGYWLPKFRRTVERDKKNQEELRQLGWNVIILWECEIKDLGKLAIHLEKAIRNESLINHERPSQIQMAAEKSSSYDSHQY